MIDSAARDAKLLASFFRSYGKPLTYKKGRKLSPEDLKDHIVYVKNGYLIANTITKPTRSRARAYYTFGPSNIIQIQSLLPDKESELTYTTLSTALLYAAHREVMWQHVREDKALAEALISDLVRQGEMLTRRVENLSYRYASDKLIYRIINLAERFGVAKAGTIYVQMPVTHNRLGLFINMARESVSREMEKLANRGLVRYEQQHITILNPAGLVEALHEPGRTEWGSFLAIVESSGSKK